ncbi:MAG: sodium:proton antiporter [Synergistaceae bacterium]|nr:sodium:proton antiporter [Synergistaceae bacterium]
MEESVDFGVLCLLPPLVAVVLALITKQTLLSLFIAIWLGSTMINGWNPVIGFVKIVSDYLIPSIASKWNAGLLVLVTMAGGAVAVLRVTGSAQAFASCITKSVNDSKKGQIVTWLSAFLFSYTEPCLILGTIMRPITDAVKISRAKLAYILDSMGCNLAAFSPICSYGPFITGLIAAQFAAANIEGSEWGIWWRMLPFNLYGFFAMATVLLVAILKLDFGPMYTEEQRAQETGKLMADGVKPLVAEKKQELPETYRPTIWNFAVPMLCLFCGVFGTIFWTGGVGENGILGSFGKGDITLAICMGFMFSAMGAGLVGTCTGLFSPVAAFNHFVDGMAELIFVPFILISAWSISSIAGAMHVGGYLAGVVELYLTPKLVPALVFVFGALISFSTGSSWGVWSIMMPIALPMAFAFDLSIPFVVGAVISGGLFGDQCSPISDTTVMSSTGASCNHIVHVETQLPYGLTVGFAAFCGFLFGGWTGMYWASIPVAGLVLLLALAVLHKISAALRARAA